MNKSTNSSRKVRDARVQAGLSQQELGDIVGRSKQWISELERGNVKLGYDMAVLISKACNVSTDYFASVQDL